MTCAIVFQLCRWGRRWDVLAKETSFFLTSGVVNKWVDGGVAVIDHHQSFEFVGFIVASAAHFSLGSVVGILKL